MHHGSPALPCQPLQAGQRAGQAALEDALEDAQEGAMATGYSGTPLIKKLGLKEPMLLAVIGSPSPYETIVGNLPSGVTLASAATKAVDMVHVFATRRVALSKQLRDFRSILGDECPVWVSWPKRVSRVETDITEDTIRELALPLGFVDIKVCAVTEVWSGLKLVVRKELRGAHSASRAV